MKYLEENFGAGKVHLTSEELSEIKKIINSIEIAGNIYDNAFMQVNIICPFYRLILTTLL